MTEAQTNHGDSINLSSEESSCGAFSDHIASSSLLADTTIEESVSDTESSDDCSFTDYMHLVTGDDQE